MSPETWTQWLEDQKAQDIESLDLEGVSEVVDAMVVATAQNSRHLGFMAEEAMLEAKRQEGHLIAADGLEGREWIVLDFGTLMIHLMLPEVREAISLEDYWKRILRDGPPSQESEEIS